MARPKKNTNPQALADKMRRAVLQAAIEGKLTEQRQDDGDARELLAQIETEKQRLVRAGEIKRQKTLPPITEEEKPFDIPDNWEWVRLGEIVIVNPRNNAEDSLEAAFIPMTLIKDGYNNSVTFEVRKWEKIKKGYTHFANNDVVFAKITPCFQNLKSAIIPDIPNGIGAGTTEIHVLRNFDNHIDLDYLLYFVKNPRFINEGVATFTGTAGQQRVGTDFVKEYLFPLPPLAEQQRIVTKLQEVMPQLDDLSADEDALHALQTAFPRQMQASLLQAAIEGKLTQQDAATDGNAHDLIAEIQTEKQRLVRAGEIKRQKTLPPITEEEKPFDIPDNWEWVRLGDVVIVNPRNKAEDNLEAAFVPMKLVEAGYKNIFNFEVRKWKSIKTGYTHFAENDVVFAKITPCFQNLKSAVISNIPNGIGAGTTEFHVLRNFNNHIDIEYLLYFVKNPTFINDGVATFTGTAGQQRIGTDFVKEYLLPLPPLAEQRRIVDLLDQALPEIQALTDIV